MQRKLVYRSLISILAMLTQNNFAMLRAPKMIKSVSILSNINRTVATHSVMSGYPLLVTKGFSTKTQQAQSSKNQQVNKFHKILLRDFKNKNAQDHVAPSCFKTCDCASNKMARTNPSLLEASNEDGDNALVVAVKNNRIWAVDALLKKHVKTNVKDNNGDLPLKVALTNYLTLLDREAVDMCKDLDNGIMIRTKHPLYVRSSIAGRIATMLATRMYIRGENLVSHQTIVTALGKREALDRAFIEKEVDFIYASAKKRRDDLAAKFEQAAAELDKQIKASGDHYYYSEKFKGREVSIEELEMAAVKMREAVKVLNGECDGNCKK